MAVGDWHTRDVQEVCAYWSTDPDRGLSSAEIGERRQRFGLNRLDQPPGPHPLLAFLNQFKDVVVLLLIGAAIVSLLLGEDIDAVTILVIVVLNSILGFLHEYRAERALQALESLTAPDASVLRDGVLQRIDAELIVPGDIIILEGGNRIPADGRLIDESGLEVEESALTGESQPVSKNAAAVLPVQASLAERVNMVFKGTAVTRGRARVVVTATGMRTEVGLVAAMMQQSQPKSTPLQRRLGELGAWLVLICAAICLVVVLVGLRNGQPAYVMFLAGVSLAVAAVPESLPAVVTVILGLGVQRMANRQAVIRRLPAVETLGCVTVICSDKTGTLTQNRMRVGQVWLGEDAEPCSWAQVTNRDRFQRLLRSAALCNNAIPGQSGAPTDLALVAAAADAGIDVVATRRRFQRYDELPFDSSTKYMAVTCRRPGGWELHVKGAPEVLLERARGWWDGKRVRPLDGAAKQRWLQMAGAMAAQALRVLAVAGCEGVGPAPAARSVLAAGSQVVLFGLVGMIDPLRPEARAAVERCRRAGIQVLMITGDHRHTALAVGRELGLVTDETEVLDGVELERMPDRELARRLKRAKVFARVTPEHKLRIVSLLRDAGEVVAMTGDGVNDAPAVKAADIGIAMGQSGADVTREAADMILLDDNFATITSAVEEGRALYTNIRKFVRYVLASNAGEVFVMLVAMLLAWPLPLLPIHILFVNLVTDGLPAVALGLEPPEEGMMERRPRPPAEGLFAHGLGRRVVVWGVAIGLVGLAVFWGVLAATGELAVARTATLASLVVSQMFHVLACRSESRRAQPLSAGNPALLWAIVSTVAALLVITYWRPLAIAFRTAPIDSGIWLLVVASSGMLYVLLRMVSGRVVAAIFYRQALRPRLRFR